jgi:hypothetical protein
LLYGALVLISVPKKHRQNGWTTSQKIEHYTFKSRFHNNMLKAIEKNIISECHFFAICFAYFGTSDHAYEERRVYTKGLLDVLGILNEQYDNGHGFQEQPLRYLYHYILSFIRRYDSISYPRTVEMERDLYYATENLAEPCGIPDARVTHGNLANLRTFPGSKICPITVRWMLRSDIRGLRATYTTMASTQCTVAAAQLTKALVSIRSNIKATQAMPEVQLLFQSVRFTLEPKVTRVDVFPSTLSIFCFRCRIFRGVFRINITLLCCGIYTLRNNGVSNGEPGLITPTSQMDVAKLEKRARFRVRCACTNTDIHKWGQRRYS